MNIVIVEFYPSHTEVIKSWIDIFLALGKQISVYLHPGRKFKIFRHGKVEYQPLQNLKSCSPDTIYLINTVKTPIKEHAIWAEISKECYRKYLVFHNYQDYDY